MDMNIVKSCVMGYDDLNEYESAQLNKTDFYCDYVDKLHYKYPDWSIEICDNIDVLQGYKEDSLYTFVAMCFDRKFSKTYFVKFDRKMDIVWKVEISKNVFNLLFFKNHYYMIEYYDRGNSYALFKFNDNGELVDKYKFKARNARIYTLNNKLVILYDDIFSLKPWQKKAIKIGDFPYCPSAMLVIDEWD